MLVTDAERVEAEIRRLQHMRTMSRSVDLYRARADLLGGAIPVLEGFVKILGEFRKRGIAVDIQGLSSLAQTAAVQLERISVSYEADPSSILSAEDVARREFWSLLSSRNLSTGLKKALLCAWEAYVDSQELPAQNRDLLDILCQIPIFAPRVALIRSQYARISDIRGRLPQNAATFDEPALIAHKLWEFWESLDAAEIPREVSVFLQCAVDQGARMDQMTPVVEEWLKRHGLLDDLRLRFQSSRQGYNQR